MAEVAVPPDPAVIVVDRFFAHHPSTVWDALTDPALHARWWAAGDVKPVVGHRFELDMGPWGKQPCEVLQADVDRVLRYRFGVGTLNTTITWKLTPERLGTRLTLTHEGFDLESPLGRRVFDGMQPGWPIVLATLDRALQDDASYVDPLQVTVS